MQRFFLNTLKIVSGFWLIITMLSPAHAAVKDQSRISPMLNNEAPKKSPNSLLPDGLLPTEPETKPDITPKKPPVDEEIVAPSEPYDINDIPALERLQLTLDVAKRAIDAFADVGTRYDDKGLYNYPTLKEFVEKTAPGKQLEADVQKYGFKDIVEWNTAIMNVSFAFGSLLQDQEADIRHQIAAVKEDKSLSPDKKQRIIASLNALIPTKENVEIIKELKKIPAYQEKLNLLDAFE